MDKGRQQSCIAQLSSDQPSTTRIKKKNNRDVQVIGVASQRFADIVRTIILKSWFSDREILEIHQNTNDEEDTNTESDNKF